VSAPLVIGTAGHIDHGKTSLIRALTGSTELDRLPEERERGITVTLGFASRVLPDGRQVAFVDVPGHERLVRTMIAGATGIDAALLCVSAVDGVMPQTREHVAILELLGLTSGVIALTMADLVDDELAALAALDVQGAVAGTFLADAPVVPVSAVTGVGLDALIAALSALPERVRAVDGPFRMPVDRAFVRPGFGTVVTGTVWSGRLDDGAQVRLLPDEVTARVRGIERHGEAVAQALPGRRCAINLAGIERADAGRGSVVVVGPVPCPSMIDVRYTHLADAPLLPDGAPVRVLLGTAERTGRLHLAVDDDAIGPGTTPAQLRLDEPLPCLPGDRFVVRRVSPVETLGGGVVVDPWAPKLKHRDRVRHGEEILALYGGDRGVWLTRVGEVGLAAEAWAERGGTGGVAVGPQVLSAIARARIGEALLQMVEDHHRASPLVRGAFRRELRHHRLGHLSEPVFDALIDQEVAAGRLAVDGPYVRRAGFVVSLTPAQAALRDQIVAWYAEAGLDGLELRDLAARTRSQELAALVKLIEAEGIIEPVAGLGWVARAGTDEVERRVRAWFADAPELTTGGFKELTQTTRRSAIPLLEWLDRRRLTRRVGDLRYPGSAIGGAGSG